MISWYQKEGDDFVGEIVLSDSDASKVGNVIGILPEELVGNAYSIGINCVDALQKITGHNFNLDLYEYFFEEYLMEQ